MSKTQQTSVQILFSKLTEVSWEMSEYIFNTWEYSIKRSIYWFEDENYEKLAHLKESSCVLLLFGNGASVFIVTENCFHR
jgi:hypothetical protein